METITQARLDAQDDQICLLTSPLETLQQTHEHLYSLLQENQDNFHGLVMQVLKCLEKQPVAANNHSSPTTSTVLPTSPPPNLHPNMEETQPHEPTSPTPNLHPHIAANHPHEIPPHTSYMTKQVKLPTFSRSDPHGWLTQAETYFFIRYL